MSENSFQNPTNDLNNSNNNLENSIKSINSSKQNSQDDIFNQYKLNMPRVNQFKIQY